MTHRNARYSFTIISDDHGATWRIGSKQVQPYHTTECSVAQNYHGDGALYMYTRIWAHKPGEPKRGIAKSTDAGETWDEATLHGLGDTAPDCEGSMVSAVVKGTTCFFVSSPYSASRTNLTVQASCCSGSGERESESKSGGGGGGGGGGGYLGEAPGRAGTRTGMGTQERDCDWKWSSAKQVFPNPNPGTKQGQSYSALGWANGTALSHRLSLSSRET